MPPLFSKSGLSVSHLAAAAAAAVAIPAAVLTAAYSIRRVTSRGGDGDNNKFSTVPVSQWTVKHVGQWLRSLGISDTTVAAFAHNDVDGSVLLLIEESHLSSLAPKLRDMLLIREGLRSLDASQRQSSQPRKEPREASRDVPEEEEEEEKEEGQEEEGEEVNEKDLEEVFLRGVGAIETVLSSPDFERAPAAAQRNLRAACAEQLQRMQPLLSALPPLLQKKLQPCMHRAEALISAGGSSANASAVPAGEPQRVGRRVPEARTDEEQRDEVPNGLGEQLSRLHSMVDDFLRLLDATEGQVMADPQLKSLRQHIAGQIREVMTVVSRLPPTLGDPLRHKCALVLRRVHDADANTSSHVNQPPHPPSPPGRRIAPGAPSGYAATRTAATGTGETAAAVSAVVQRLRAIFALLKSSDVINMAPAPRLARIGALLQEVQELDQEAAAWSDRRAAAVVGEVVKNVMSVLQQMEALTSEEMNGSRRPSGDGARADADRSDDVESISALPEIVASLQAALRVVHSDELAQASPEMQSRIVGEISRRLREVRRRVQRLPLSEATATVAEMTERAIVMVRSLPGGDPADDMDDEDRGARGGRPATAGAPNEEHKSSAAAGPVNPLQSVQKDGTIEEAIEQLEEIFEFVNSEGFSALAPAERAALAREQLSRLVVIEKRIEQCGGDEELRELVLPLREILQLESSASAMPQQEQRREPLQRQREQEESGVASANAASSVVAQLEAVVTFVQSPDFTSADAVTRQRFAVELVRRLGAIEAGCRSMGGPVAPLVTIAQRLRTQLLAIAEPATRGATENEQANAPDSENVSANASSGPSASRNTNTVVDGDDDASAAGRAWNAAGDPIAALVATIEDLRVQLRRVTAPGDLIPVMTAVDRALSEADTRNVDWREDDRAVRVIAAALDEIQLAQQRISRQPSELQRVLLEAARGLQESPPETPAQLRPYADLLVRVRQQLGSIPEDAQEAFVTLHRAVLNATEVLRRRVELAGDGRSSNNTATTTTTTNNNNNSIGGGGDGDDDSDRAGNDRIAEVLLGVSDQLREGNVPDEILDQYALLLDEIDAVGGDPARADAIHSIREQLRLQRLLNGHDDAASDDADEQEEEEEEEEDEDEEDEEKEEGEVLMEHQIDEDMDTEEVAEVKRNNAVNLGDNGADGGKEDILGAEDSELLLLPRIENRLLMTPGSFSACTTPFDIHNMSATLLRLTQSPRVLNAQTLLERVTRAKTALVQHHSKIDASHPASPPITTKLQLHTMHTGGAVTMTLQTAAGSPGVASPAKPGDVSRTPAPDSSTIAAWHGRSVAVIVCAPADSVATAPAELAGLRILLAERYGFDVVALPADNANRLCEFISKVAAGGVTRLLVYCNATASAGAEHVMCFTDSSLLLPGELIKSTAAIKHVLLAQCGASQMSLLPALDGAVGPTLELNVTDAAFGAVRERRCWLYDGLFTPALAELLSLDAQTALSPVDLIFGTAKAIAGTRLQASAAVDNPAVNMAFLVPLDEAQ